MYGVLDYYGGTVPHCGTKIRRHSCSSQAYSVIKVFSKLTKELSDAYLMNVILWGGPDVSGYHDMRVS